jgi:hypothetical protein
MRTIWGALQRYPVECLRSGISQPDVSVIPGQVLAMYLADRRRGGNLDQPRDWPKSRASNDILEAHAQVHQSHSLATARAWWRAGAQAAQKPIHERASAMSRTLVLGKPEHGPGRGLIPLAATRRDRCQRATADRPGRQSSGRSPHGGTVNRVGRVGSDARVGTPEVERAAQSRLRPSAATLSAESVAFCGSVGPIELESIMRDEDLAVLILTVA